MDEELHKRAIKKFTRRKVMVKFVNEIWGIDLIEMPKDINEYNENKFIFCVIDCFSRFVYCVAMKNKKAETTIEALKLVVKKAKAIPKKIWTDEGVEFLNKEWKKYLDDNEIILYHTYGEHKCSIVERFNRTLKEIMFKDFTKTEDYKWEDKLDKYINFYNNRIHRSLKMSPKDAKNEDNEIEIFNKVLKDDKKIKEGTKKFKIGDRVRIAIKKNTFEKGYTKNWTDTIYKVVEVKQTKPITYLLENLEGKDKGKTILGSFYNEEIQKTKY
jgi:hypothetical protein